jgi:hypothetical protein
MSSMATSHKLLSSITAMQTPLLSPGHGFEG